MTTLKEAEDNAVIDTAAVPVDPATARDLLGQENKRIEEDQWAAIAPRRPRVTDFVEEVVQRYSDDEMWYNSGGISRLAARKPRVTDFVEEVVQRYSDDEPHQHFRSSRLVAEQLAAVFVGSLTFKQPWSGGR
ncbi:hypothetical protein MRX96_040712 [Rhipicephalus microplus]